METTQNDTRCESICLRNQICFPLYACAKEAIRQYRKPLEALGLTYTQYRESCKDFKLLRKT